jgi:hypothetical protein
VLAVVCGLPATIAAFAIRRGFKGGISGDRLYRVSGWRKSSTPWALAAIRWRCPAEYSVKDPASKAGGVANIKDVCGGQRSAAPAARFLTARRTGGHGQGFSFAAPRFGMAPSFVLLSCVFSARSHLRLLLLCVVVGPNDPGRRCLEGAGSCRPYRERPCAGIAANR